MLARATPRAALVAALAFCSLAGAADAAPPAKERSPLSPALAQLAKPAVRALPAAQEARALGVAVSGPGSLVRRGSRVLVYVRHQPGLGTVPALRRQGAEVVADSPSLRTVTAAVSPDDLEAIARTPGVLAVTQVRAPVLRAACDGGSVISEGVAQLNVVAARAEFGVDGQGVEVGVLSDSFDQATEAVPGGPIATDAEEDEKSGDLPGSESPCATQKAAVDELEPYEFFDQEPSFDEGRGMLQIVHDVAPEADLAFHSAFNGELDFAHGIEDLAAAGADVIVDDVGYFEEPFFQDGPVADAVTAVTAAGNTYLSSAGNDNLFDGEGNEIASWEAPAYRDSGDCPPQVRSLSGFNATHCLDFNPGATTDRTFGIRVEAEETLTLDLQWAEPWFGVDNDLDAFLLDDEGELLTASYEANLDQKPIEILQWENPSDTDRVVQLVVNHFAGSGAPRLKFVLLQNGGGVSGIEYPKSGGGDVVGPAIYGHAAAASAIAVGAVPFNQSSKPEEYSSRGPATHYFGPVAGKKPAPELATPEVISKPDVAATDCGRTTFFARQTAPGIWRFCGTSAAAPHAAGVVALMQEAAPSEGPELFRPALAETAVPVGAFGPCAVGGGLIEAVGAVEAADEETVTIDPNPCEPPDASGAVFVAPGDWGSETPPVPPVGPVTPPTPQTPSAPPSPPPVTRVAPSTSIAKHPRASVRTRRARVRLVFRFATDQADAGFLCKVDRAAFRPCGARLARRFAIGRHVVKVKARGATGLVDSTPAVFRFRVIAVR